jgi:hypothetical protein
MSCESSRGFAVPAKYAMKRWAESRSGHGMRQSIARCLSIVLVMFCAAAPAQAAVVTVPTGSDPLANGDNFQAVISGATCGDTIVLQAGASYQTRVAFVNSYGPQGYPFLLPNKGNCNGQYITIQSSGIAALPAGVRVGPGQRSQMAQLASNTNSWVIEPAAGASYYRFIGIEFTHTAKVAAMGGFSPVIVFLSKNEAPYGAWGHHMTLDRCIVWPYEEWGRPTSNVRSAAVGVRADGTDQTIINSYVAGFMGFESNAPTTPAQSTGVESVAGPGPVTITNNFIEAWYSNIFTGGGGGYVDPAHTSALSSSTLTTGTLLRVTGLAVGDYIAFQVPTFVNAHGLQTSWVQGTVTAINGLKVTFTPLGDPSPNPPSVPGSARWNGLNVSGIQVIGNTLSKRWEWANGGFGIAKSYWEMKSGVNVLVEGNRFLGPGANVMGPVINNQSGDSPWTMVKNVVIRNNLMLSSGGINIELGGSYYGQGTGIGGPVTFSNNLLGASAIRADGLVNGHGQGITWTHNTIRGVTASMWRQDTTPGSLNVVYRDNIIHSGRYWMQGWPGSFPGGVKDHNVIINNSGGAPPAGFQADFIVANDAAVGFVNVSGADSGGDYHGYALGGASPFKGRGSDGTNPGVDFAALDAALNAGGGGGSDKYKTLGPRPPSNLTVK